MAKKVDFEFNKPKAGNNTYPWNDWLDGDVWEITEGEDFICKSLSMKTNLQAQARKRNLMCQVKFTESGLICQAVPAIGSAKKSPVKSPAKGAYVPKKQTHIKAEVKGDDKWRTKVLQILHDRGELGSDANPLLQLQDLADGVNYLEEALQNTKEVVDFHDREWSDGRLHITDQVKAVIDAVGDIELSLAHICSIMNLNIDGCRNEALIKLQQRLRTPRKTADRNGKHIPKVKSEPESDSNVFAIEKKK